MAERQLSSELGAVECYVFIDDSNLWIEGQKAQGRKLKDTDIDPRYRTDLGRFLNMVLHRDQTERSINKAFLYGSIPPPNDTLWNAARKKNFEVKTFQRSISGKEKKVDVAMATDITDVATEKKYCDSERQTVFIVVTGDKDLITPIECAMTKSELISIELWAWDFSMAREFRQLANKEDRLTVRKLDNVELAFSYKEFKSTRSNAIDPTKAIVYRDVPSNKRFYYAFANDMCRLLRLFYITSIDFSGKRDLIVEFPKTKIEVVISELKRCKIGNEPCSYPEYMTTRTEQTEALSTTNRFEALADLDDSEDAFSEAIESSLSLDLDQLAISTHEKGATGSESDMDDTWILVARSKAGKKAWKQKRKTLKCTHGIHCSSASACPYLHSDQEQKIFRVQSHVKFKFWKSRLCTKQEHQEPTTMEPERLERCQYAHNDTDSWCLECAMYGHLTEDCKVE